MKRAQKQDEKCRRMEFKCKIYDLIKEIDRSMQSGCGQSQPPPSQGLETRNNNGYPGKERKQKGAECCCPPGCCKESMEFRMPKILPKDPPSPQEPPAGSADPQGPASDYLWHNEDHSWGCRPVAEGGPGSQSGRMLYPGGGGVEYNPNVGGAAGPGYGGGSPRCGGGSPNMGGGCCSYSPVGNFNPEPSTKAFQFPQSPEEATQRGCFVARSA